MTGFPEELLRDLRSVKGFDKAALLAAHDEPAITSIRLNPEKQADIFPGTENVPWCAEGRYLEQRPVFTLDPYFHAGAYYVQEASSMFLAHMVRELVPDRSGLRVLDLCAAPGGKSTLLASLLERDSLLISNEVIRSRASILEENMTRWGLVNTWVTSNDPRDLGKLEGYFDVIVVDAPCSGSGLFRKDAGAIDEWSEQNVQLCSERQGRILADVWPALKENGLLIYATCSYSPKEDEDILDKLASEFCVESLKVNVPAAWGIVETLSEQKNLVGYRFFPDKVKGEGFFIAALRKTSESGSLRSLKFRSKHDKKIWEQAAHLLDRDKHVCVKQGDEYCAVLSEHEPDLQLLQQFLYFRKTGVALGQPGAKEWLPAHDLALFIDRSHDIPAIELDRDNALRFLKKEDVFADGYGKGWHIVSYKGMGLGWVKNLGNRFNNYLPKHWRIRMSIDGEERP